MTNFYNNILMKYDISRFKCDTANMSIVESNDSNNQMVRHENKVIKIDTWDQYDDKTGAELLTSTQVYYNLCDLILIILWFHNYALDFFNLYILLRLGNARLCVQSIL